MKGKLVTTQADRDKGAKKSIEGRYKHLLKLDQVPQVIEVKTMSDACSPAIIEYAREYLIAGGRWDELRRHFGLGPSNVDRRWRKLREAVIESMVPRSREQALLGQSSVRQFLMAEIDAFTKEVNIEINGFTDDSGQVHLGVTEKNRHHYYKMKLEALRARLDENSREFDAFAQIELLKTKEKHNQGASIIVQNNYHINRPGDVPLVKGEDKDGT